MNIDLLAKEMDHILAGDRFEAGQDPNTFIRGGQSDYIYVRYSGNKRAVHEQYDRDDLLRWSLGTYASTG